MPVDVGRPQCLVAWPHGPLHRTARVPWQLGSWLFSRGRDRNRYVNTYLKMGATAFYNLILEWHTITSAMFCHIDQQPRYSVGGISTRWSWGPTWRWCHISHSDPPREAKDWRHISIYQKSSLNFLFYPRSHMGASFAFWCAYSPLRALQLRTQLLVPAAWLERCVCLLRAMWMGHFLGFSDLSVLSCKMGTWAVPAEVWGFLQSFTGSLWRVLATWSAVKMCCPSLHCPWLICAGGTRALLSSPWMDWNILDRLLGRCSCNHCLEFTCRSDSTERV